MTFLLKGFTLVEILIVIAIIGILISLILPLFEDVRRDADTKVCVGNLRGLANAMLLYETAKNTDVDWDTRFPEILVQWQYLSVAPYCPYAPSSPGQSDRYTLVDDSGTTPNKATCPYVGTYTDHLWP